MERRVKVETEKQPNAILLHVCSEREMKKKEKTIEKTVCDSVERIDDDGKCQHLH